MIHFLDDVYDGDQIMNNLHLQSENEQRIRKCGCTIACVMKRQNMVTFFYNTFVLYIKRTL